jgi:hypothetical protein
LEHQILQICTGGNVDLALLQVYHHFLALTEHWNGTAWTEVGDLEQLESNKAFGVITAALISRELLYFYKVIMGNRRMDSTRCSN